MTLRTVRIAGLAAFLSMLMWLTTGIGWWAPAVDGWGEMRMMALTLLHVFAMFAAVISYT